MISAGMRGRAIAAVLVATAALIVFAPAAGAVKTRTVHQAAHVMAEIGGKATNGFHFIVYTFKRSVVLSLYHRAGQQGMTIVGYSASHQALSGLAKGRLDIKIGDRGHFRGHLVAKATKVQKPRKGCTGEPTMAENGYFVGSFIFHGERAYTTIEAQREGGSIIRQGATDCRIPAESGRPAKNSKGAEERAEKAAERDEYRLIAGDRKADLVLEASREEVPPGPNSAVLTAFDVSAKGDKVGAFDVYRSAFVFDTRHDAASSLLTPNRQEPLAEATLEPPAPFSGSATFRLEGRKTAIWTGDLAVELPGAGKLPLTGPKIYAGACEGATNCTETLPGRLGDLIEGGGGFTGSFETQSVY